MDPKTEEETKAVEVPLAKYKKGDKVNLSYNGEVYPVTVKSSTVIGFLREYCIEYRDGSKRYVTEHEFANQLN